MSGLSTWIMTLGEKFFSGIRFLSTENVPAYCGSLPGGNECGGICTASWEKLWLCCGMCSDIHASVCNIHPGVCNDGAFYLESVNKDKKGRKKK